MLRQDVTEELTFDPDLVLEERYSGIKSISSSKNQSDRETSRDVRSRYIEILQGGNQVMRVFEDVEAENS